VCRNGTIILNGELQKQTTNIFGHRTDIEKIQMVEFFERSVLFYDFIDVTARWLRTARRSWVIDWKRYYHQTRFFAKSPWHILIIVQRDATQSSLFVSLQVHSTCFGCQPHPSSGVHKTVTTASGTGHAMLCSYLPPTWPRWREVAAQIIRPVPKAVVTVLCTPDDERCWHPKHVEWTCRITNK